MSPGLIPLMRCPCSLRRVLAAPGCYPMVLGALVGALLAAGGVSELDQARRYSPRSHRHEPLPHSQAPRLLGESLPWQQREKRQRRQGQQMAAVNPWAMPGMVSRSVSACSSAARLILSLPLARLGSFAGSFSPEASASSIARPEMPITSLTTLPSLILAPSRSFWTRLPLGFAAESSAYGSE